MRIPFVLVLVAVSAWPLTATAVEICGNSIDDDGDGLADEQCYPSLTTSQCISPLNCDEGDISPSTGSLHYSLPPDVAPRVPFGPSLAFSRFLLSQNTPGATPYRKPMGDRWGHVFMSWLTKNTIPNPDQIIVHLPHGQEALFKQTGANVSGWDEYKTYQSGFHFQTLRQRVASPNEYELKTMNGDVLAYDSSGKLMEIRDSLATPNVVSIGYDGTTGQISTVTDASTKRRLSFSYAPVTLLLTSVAFQINTGTWQTQHTTTYGYTGTNLTTVSMGGATIQTNTYDIAGNVTQITDGDSKVIVNFAYETATPGKIVRVDTPRGMVGYEFSSSRSNCSGQTVLAFHRANSTSCSADSDCGTGNICSGKTGVGSTGVCFRGARCLTVSSPSEDVITTISSFAGGAETCDGACLDAIDHVWTTTSGKLDLTAVKDPTNYYTTKEFTNDGLPKKIVYGDNDSDPSSGGERTIFLFYDSTFPGRVSEMRRKSDVEATGLPCTASDARGCQQTVYTYTSDGKLDTVRQLGFTLNSSGTQAGYDFTTNYDYDAKGRLTSIDGPLTGTFDSTTFDYWSGAGALKDDFLRYFKQQTAPSGAPSPVYLTRTVQDYDFWGHPIALQDPDGTLTCLTFSSTRGHLIERREAMNGQTSCTSHSSDIVTQYLRDSGLRLTKLTRPDDSCLIYEYDARGRLSKTKRRDDCNTASSGDREEYTYNDEGLVTKIEVLNASSTVTRRKELVYFDSRRVEKILNPVDTAKWTGFTYEARGLIDSITMRDNSTDYAKTKWAYNAEGRVSAEERYTAGSSFDTWNLMFDWIGNQSQVTDGDSKVTASKRDDLGRMVKLINPDLGGYPTLRVYDDASRLSMITEGLGGSGEKVHAFTFDPIGRPLEAQYAGHCDGPSDIPDVVRVYDAPPGSCPAATSCANTNGRLAYVKVKLMCDTNQTDKTLEQKTWFGYDAAGRLTHEYIEDDVSPTPRTAAHVYEWTKNGTLSKVTLPSTAVVGWTFGSGGSNSDTDRITAMWRTSTSTPIADDILYEPFGPVRQYDQQNSISSKLLKTRASRNLAYRITETRVMAQDESATHHKVTITEDAAGRVAARDYDPNAFGAQTFADSYFLYDLQNRVLCETPSLETSCPTTGTPKNVHSLSPPFTAAGDWKRLLRPILGTSTKRNDFTLTTGTHQIASVDQSESGSLGVTAFSYNTLGNRSSDDNTTSLTNDARSYGYDSRRNLTSVTGKFYTGSAWHDYAVVSSFDHKNRRVFKSFTDTTASTTATWFFYYDALDRLTEVRHTPDASASSTYSMFQLFWLGNRLVAFWQTDYPSTTTSKRYTATDESGRPIALMSWPSSGDAAFVWGVSPSAWGFERVLQGATVFQPILFSNQYKDEETTAWQNGGSTVHRPGLVLNGYRTYDPWTGGYLQVDPLVDSTWSTYVYAKSNPVGKEDPRGLKEKDEEEPGPETEPPGTGDTGTPWSPDWGGGWDGGGGWGGNGCVGWGCGDWDGPQSGPYGSSPAPEEVVNTDEIIAEHCPKGLDAPVIDWLIHGHDLPCSELFVEDCLCCCAVKYVKKIKLCRRSGGERRRTCLRTGRTTFTACQLLCTKKPDPPHCSSTQCLPGSTDVLEFRSE